MKVLAMNPSFLGNHAAYTLLLPENSKQRYASGLLIKSVEPKHRNQETILYAVYLTLTKMLPRARNGGWFALRSPDSMKMFHF